MRRACAFTGHRPGRFRFGYDEDDPFCIRLKQKLHNEIEKLVQAGVTRFYTGMALGVDQWAALAVLDLKKNYPDVELIAVLPCESQADKWSPEQRSRYFDEILPRVDETILLQRQYTPNCMSKRNRWLVDHADYLLAVYDRSQRGGAAHTVRYAKQRSRMIIVIDPDSFGIQHLGAMEKQRFHVVEGGKAQAE